MMELQEVVKLFVVGYACGHILSVIPYLVGCLIDFAFAIIHERR